MAGGLQKYEKKRKNSLNYSSNMYLKATNIALLRTTLTYTTPCKLNEKVFLWVDNVQEGALSGLKHNKMGPFLRSGTAHPRAYSMMSSMGCSSHRCSFVQIFNIPFLKWVVIIIIWPPPPSSSPSSPVISKCLLCARYCLKYHLWFLLNSQGAWWLHQPSLVCAKHYSKHS